MKGPRLNLWGVILSLLLCQVSALTVTERQVFQPRDLNPLQTTPLFGSVVAISSDEAYLAMAYPGFSLDRTTTATGKVDIYRVNETLNEYSYLQTIGTFGTADHFGAIGLKFFQDKGKTELYVSAVGTPLGDTGNLLQNQDMRGSLVIYQVNDETGLFNIKTVINASTPGLENLTPRPLEGTNVEVGAKFGLSFDISEKGDWLVVGALGQNVTNSSNGIEYWEAGAAYVFRRNNINHSWTFGQQIVRPNNIVSNFSYFGFEVAISGKWMFISDANSLAVLPDEPPKRENGIVYIYQRKGNTWEYHSSLISDQSQSVSDLYGISDVFGCSMSASGDWLLVGSCFYSNDAMTQGAAFFYHLEPLPRVGKTWVLKQKVTSDLPAPRNLFGVFYVKISDRRAVISDLSRQVGNNLYQGAVQVFELDNYDEWQRAAVITYSNGTKYDFFGNGVDLGGRDSRLVLAGPNALQDIVLGAVLGIGPNVRPFTPNPDPPFTPGYAVLFQLED